MTPSDRRKVLQHPDVHILVLRLAELWADHTIGFLDAPTAYFKAVDATLIDCLEEALLTVDIPVPAEWADGSDEAADRQREESLGL